MQTFLCLADDKKFARSFYRIIIYINPISHALAVISPAFTTEMDADILQANSLDQEQERLKSLLELKTEELKEVTDKLTQNYSLSKKTVKMAEPQANWVAYGITDKR